MKKLLLLAGSMLLFSCATNEDLKNEDNSSLSKAKIQLFEKASKEKQSSDPITYKCGSSSYVNPINVNPNFPYIYWYDVIYKEGTPFFGRNQIYLDHFLAEALFTSISNPHSSVPNIYYGYNAYGDYMSDPANYTNYVEFSFGQDADNASYYGDMFPYNQGMNNDAANTVYHYFKTYIDQYTSQGYTVVAAHIFTESYLCIPAAKGVRIRLKLIN